MRKKLLELPTVFMRLQNMKQILVDLKIGILNLFNANSLTIYVVDKFRNEIYCPVFLAGTIRASTARMRLAWMSAQRALRSSARTASFWWTATSASAAAIA